MSSISVFQEEFPSNESYWRSVVLFGRNVASYKFALAQALLELAGQGKTHISAQELAIPYAQYLCSHLQAADRQGTSRESRFLAACRDYNQQRISQDQLITSTVQLGFNNVLDAFHVVNGMEIPNRFFIKQSTGNTSGIILTDNVYRLLEIPYEMNLLCEVEARWKLVETAWDLSIPTSALKVEHDLASGLLILENSRIRRKSITPARHALNGYQKGKCFYCFTDINVTTDDANDCEIDHFMPHLLQRYMPQVNLNGIWNLVLACPRCNRGAAGKHARVPAIKYLERLNKRNNFLVNSHHPLRETIINQTGMGDEDRRQFLQMIDIMAVNHLSFRWTVEQTQEDAF